MTVETQPISLREQPNISWQGMWARGAERFRRFISQPRFSLLRPFMAAQETFQETAVPEQKVAKTKKMLELEQRFGTNIESLLSTLYTSEGKTQVQVAIDLGIGRSTVSSWMKRFGIETRQAINRRQKKEEQRALDLALANL